MADLLSSLEDLRERLNKSGVERTTGLRDNMGDDCHYYRKSRDLFLQKDFEDIKQLVQSVVDQYRLIEKDYLRK